MRKNDPIVPVAVFAFNRPVKLTQTLENLRIQNIDRLIVFIDAPRYPSEVELVEQCKHLAENIDWIDTELHFKETNGGLPGIINNINSVLRTYSAAIFVEDDCLPMPGFYCFMTQALKYYEANNKVFSIGGYQPISKNFFKNYPYSLVSSARFMCWGWGTWRDRWESITPHLPKYKELYNDWTMVPDIAGNDFPKIIRDCARGNEINSWAFRVAIVTLWIGKIHLLPTKGLVRNIGQDTGVHAPPATDPRWRLHNCNISEHLPRNIVWLDQVELNQAYVKMQKKFTDKVTLPLSLLDRVYVKLGFGIK